MLLFMSPFEVYKNASKGEISGEIEDFAPAQYSRFPNSFSDFNENLVFPISIKKLQ